ncbi:MAG: CGNR zinc finger domain-containing protein [Armatimonadetes bacterium]|nr:CGNR zinc finger domain-containing protein [Armatimonadota bacterium]
MTGSDQPGWKPLYSTTWVRTRYFVEDGLIRPAGARLEAYDPFREGYFPPDSPKAGQSIYLGLLALNLRRETEIEQWVNRWGILGLCQHQIVASLHPAEFQPAGLYDYVRECVLVVDEPSRWGICYQVVLKSDYFASYFPALRSGDLTTRPRDPEELEVEELWSRLCEPVEGFREAVRQLREAYNLCQSWQSGRRSEDLFDRIGVQLTYHIHRTHNALGYSAVDDTWRDAWSFPSLLSALYMMLYQDFINGRELRVCGREGCGRPFVADRDRQRFCSDSCRNRVKQKAWRERQEQKKQALAEAPPEGVSMPSSPAS